MALFSHMPLWGAARPPVLTYIGTVADSTNTDTYTFTGAAIGTASADRLVVVVVHAGDSASVSGVTIAGNAMTDVVQAAQVGSPPLVGIFTRNVAAGTTADIVVTLADAAVHAAINVYTITGLNSMTAQDFDSTTGTGTGDSSVTLTCSVGSAVIAAAETYTADATFTWSGGVSEDNEEAYGGESGTGGAASGTATGTSITPNLAVSVSADRAFVAACWR